MTTRPAPFPSRFMRRLGAAAKPVTTLALLVVLFATAIGILAFAAASLVLV